VPADEAVLRRPGIRLENQSNEGHAAMAGQGFALLTPLLWKATWPRAAVRAIPRPGLIARLGLLADLPAGAADGAQGQALPRVAADEMRQALEEIDGGWAAQGRVPELAGRRSGED